MSETKFIEEAFSYLASLGYDIKDPGDLAKKFMASRKGLIKKATIEDRKAKFIQRVKELRKPEYDDELIEGFVEYWTEHNYNGRKMKFEMMKTFSIGGRLKTWHRNKVTNFGRKTQGENNPSTVNQGRSWNQSR